MQGLSNNCFTYLNITVKELLLLISPHPPHRSSSKRDMWNISPISEDFSESDKEFEMEGIVPGHPPSTNDNDVTISSINATFGDTDTSMLSR